MGSITITGGRGRLALALCAFLSGCERTDLVEPRPKPAFVIALVSDSVQVGVAGDVAQPIVVSVVDSLEQPAAGVMVSFETDGILQGPVTALTDAAGEATSGWRFDWQPREYTISARIVGMGPAVRVKAQVAAHPLSKVVVVLGEAIAGESRLVAVESESPRALALVVSRHHLPPGYAPGPNDWVMAFGQGAAPVVARLAWTEHPDTLKLTLRDPLPVHITVWVFELFESNRSRAESDIGRTNGLWANRRWGLTMGDVRIKDTTAYNGAPIHCGALPTFIDPGRINIYLSDAAAMTAFGERCSISTIIIRPAAMTSARFVLAHEIGHTFGLLHESHEGNLMHPFATGAGVTTGQIQTAHFNFGSSLNAVFGHRTTAELASCCLSPGFP